MGNWAKLSHDITFYYYIMYITDRSDHPSADINAILARWFTYAFKSPVISFLVVSH